MLNLLSWLTSEQARRRAVRSERLPTTRVRVERSEREQRLITLVLVVSISLSFAVPTLADEAKKQAGMTMTKDEVDTLLASGNFKHVKNKQELPKGWLEGMNAAGMADIGGEFSGGCTGPAPHTRMIAAAVSEPYGVILWESGGFVYWVRLQVFKHEHNKFESVYTEQNVTEERAHEIRKKMGE